MKKSIISMILLAVMLFCCQGCDHKKDDETTGSDSTEGETVLQTEEITSPVTDEQTKADDPEPDPDPRKASYNILFIGNSYTQRNNLSTALFASMAKAAGYENVNVEAVIKGGETLANHALPTTETGAVIDQKLSSKKYDYVVIQEQSDLPASNPGAFYDGARALNEKIKANGAKTIMYETWGKKTGHANLTAFGWTSEEMTWRIAASYSAIANELGATVAYAGLAFSDIYVNNPGINLYDPDLSHPSYDGSYLAAMTIFATIFNENPENVAYDGTTDAQTAAILRGAARRAAFETPAIPEKYVTASEGVHKDAGGVDTSKTVNLQTMPTTPMISVVTGGTYESGKSFSGILGTKGQTASTETSSTGLSDAQKADIADIGYGISMIGIEKMNADYPTAVGNLVNGHWGSSMMSSFTFDDLKYDISGTASDNGKYRCLITLNFGDVKTFKAIGFISGNLKGFPGAAEVYVSNNGTDWTIVPTACWDRVNGNELVDLGKSPADPWNSNTSKATCLFDMNGAEGQYIRIGVVIGRSDSEANYNTINTRELVVY